MPRKSRQNPAIRDFILHNVANHPADIVALTSEKFGISRSALAGYMAKLVAEGLLEASGNTRARRYESKPISSGSYKIDLSPGLPEHHVFRFRLLPLMKDVPKNVVDICQYGFTEMLNNAIDHSQSPDAVISYEQTPVAIKMWVIDHGVGIFAKIQKDFGLADPRSALLELSKGKLTSDRANHAGEGIFFTSRMFDDFQIHSGHLIYNREHLEDDDWLIETKDVANDVKGTVIKMTISPAAKRTTAEVFEKVQGEDISFRKTHVPVSLGRYPGEQLVSRSQAKRILARFDQFSEVMLDFDGVPQIGQAFADEIFRVFAGSHPGTRVVPIRANEAVRKMIDYVKNAPPPATPPAKP